MAIILHEPADAYHANPAIGSGDIRDLIKSPALFRDRQTGLARKSTPAMLFGHASHMALLEPMRYATEVAMKPKGMSFGTSEGKIWQARNADRLIVSHEDGQALDRIHQRMPAEVKQILKGSDTEVTVRRDLDGIQVQCRFDVWSKDRSKAYDFKSIADIDTAEKSIWRLRYDIQERWYSLLAELETGTRPEFSFVFFETELPHRWRIIDLDADFKARADEDLDRAFLDLRARMASGDWTDAAPLHQTVSLPRWASGEDFTISEDGGISL